MSSHNHGVKESFKIKKLKALPPVLLLIMVIFLFTAPAVGAAGDYTWVNSYSDHINSKTDSRVTEVVDLVSQAYSEGYAEKVRYLLGTSNSVNSDYAIFGGKAWPVPNSGDYNDKVYDDGYPGGVVGIHNCKGCMAYASYCTVIFENEKINKHDKSYANDLKESLTTDEVKTFIRNNVQVGEHIRLEGFKNDSSYRNNNVTKYHSIVFLAEDEAGDGFYFVHSHGVADQKAMFAYTTYDHFKEYCNHYHARLFVYNTYSGTVANPIASGVSVSTLDEPYVTDTTAILSGNLVRNGESDVICGFTYGMPSDNLEGYAESGNMGSTTGIFSSEITGLKPATTYNFISFATPSGKVAAWGVEKSFSTKPGAFDIISPTSGSAKSNSSVTVKWEDSEGAIGYKLSLRDLSDTAADPNGNQLFDNVDIGSSRAYTFSLTPGHNYRVAVGAYSAMNTEMWKECEFSVMGNAATPSLLQKPDIDKPSANGGYMTGYPVSVSWIPTGDVVPDRYSVEVYRNGVALWSTTTSSTYCSIPADHVDMSGQYSVYIYPQKSGHDEVVWETVEFAVTDSFQVTYPEANAIVPANSALTISWKSVPFANGYMISLRDLDYDRLAYNREDCGMSRSFTVPADVLIDGHSFRAAVCAYNDRGSAIETCEVWQEFEFTVEGDDIIIPDVPVTTYETTITVVGEGLVVATPATAAAGTPVTLTIVPDNGYEFAGWDVESDVVSISGNSFVMPATDVRITATFRVAAEAPATRWRGEGTQENPYRISTANELLLLARNVSEGNNYYGKYFEVTDDIDLSSVCGESRGSWMPIGTEETPFKGTFDGSNNVISNLYINANADCLGLFGVTDGANIKNVWLKNVEITGNNYIGGFVGKSTDFVSIYDSFVENVSITGSSYLGGLVGKTGGTVGINCCYSTGSIVSMDPYSLAVGGLIGMVSSEGSIYDCYTTCTIISGGDSVGGLVGEAYVTYSSWGDGFRISDSYATGLVTGGDKVGGLVGYIYIDSRYAQISNSYSRGDVIGGKSIGGLVGYFYLNYDSYNNFIRYSYSAGNVTGSNKYVGGIIGQNHANSADISIYDCYSTGIITGDIAGGLVGMNDVAYASINIDRCYSSGSVSTGDYRSGYAGGLVGQNDAGATIQNSIALNPSVTGLSSVGRITGSNSGTLTNNYALSTMICSANDGISVTPTEALKKNFYVEIFGDFPYNYDGWKMVDSNISKYPILTWQIGTPLYSITIEDNENGVVIADAELVPEGTIVNLKAIAEPGYKIYSINHINNVYWTSETSFTMPGCDVVISASFDPMSPDEYYYTEIQTVGYGAATASPSSAPAGTKVTLSTVAGPNYEFDHWEIVSGLDAIEENNTFIMPTTNVQLKAVFVFNETPSDEPTIPLPTTLNLQKGWNFISFPSYLGTSSDTASELFGSIDTAGQGILQYDTAEAEWSTLSRSSAIEPLNGYWIYSSDLSIVNFAYSTDKTQTPPTKQLYAGWNAVGLCADKPISAKTAFTPLKWVKYLPWNVEAGKWNDVIVNGGSAPNSEENTIAPGNGGWLYVEEEGIYSGNTA